jgi:ABC-type polysaccharide/polyol phosphate transport system ATPase subunit
MDTAIVCDHVSKRFQLKKDRADSVGQLLYRMLPVGRRSHRATSEPFWALRDVSFELKFGKSLGIIGHNGAGKSTLLKILTRTMRPTTGSIQMNGHVSALIELGAGFHPDFTGRENIYLNASILGLTRREIAGRIPEIVEFSELEEFIDTPVKYYSSGMNARLGFAVATSVRPEILIVDEVLAVGDEGFQKKCLEKITAMKQEGVSILLVSHALNTIATLMDEALWVEHGEVRGFGSPAEVVAAYRAADSDGAEDQNLRMVIASDRR